MLTTRLTGLLVAGLLLLLTAAPAGAAGPATVTVRVEGAADTLVPRTSVTTTTAPVNKDGQAGHTCTGTSVAGALQVATGGAWTATWSASVAGYFVTAIKGEAPAGSDYFTLWINGSSSMKGICEAELQQGDEVLFYVQQCDAAPAPVYCSNPPVQPLSLAVPATATAGEPFGVRVVELADGGAQTPAAGATVSGGVEPVTTGADGTAVVTLAASGTLRATKAGRARSASEAVAVTAAAANTPPTIVDAVPPAPLAGRIGSIDEQQRFARGRGPRTLRGDVQAGLGVRDVRLRLTRTARGRCETFDGRRERFVRLSRCGAARGRWFSIGDRAAWSYLLPSRLGRGRYVLDVEVADASGARDRTLQRGRNRVVFHVA
jgi:hypothetical protein